MEGLRIKRAAVMLLLFCLLCSPAAAADARDVRLVPSGRTVGIHVEANGLLVIGVTEVDTAEGPRSPAWEAGMRVGDLIVAIGAEQITTVSELKAALKGCEGAVAVRFLRDGREMQLSVIPIRGNCGEEELGLWLRSAVSGLGTLTFYDPVSGSFGALGHGVSDGDTGLLIPLKAGCIGDAAVLSISQGEKGRPGEVKGNLGLESPLGQITKNSGSGIFGVLTDAFPREEENLMGICPRAELRCGPATILTDIGGQLCAYAVEISRIYPENSGGKDLLLTVTDPDLLALTGGIVQGMSGSPIIQSGCLAGAVTHVLVNDPTRGYGIGIERMLEAAA